jgi:NADPH2:quinone reductase
VRAIVVPEYGSSDVCELREVDPPDVGPGEVLVDVEAVGLNFADIVRRRGEYPGTEKPPYVPGREAAGVISEVGEGVEHDVGDRVVVFVSGGAYAEQVVAPESSTFDIPESMSFEEAAGFPIQFLTAYHVLHTCGDIEGAETCLVHAAAGGVGTAAVQLAARAGTEIFATASTDSKRELAASLGADHTIDYTTEDVADVISRHTDDRGVDLVLDGVGGDVFHESLDALAPFGRLVTYGFASGEIADVDTGRLLFENDWVVGFHLRNAIRTNPDMIHAAVPELSKALVTGDLRVVVGETYPLAAACEAQESIESRQSKGKVVLEL